MRSKALPPSLRAAPTHPSETSRTSGHQGGGWRAPLVMLLLLAILIPWMSVNAASAMTVNPSTARPGASVLVHGQGFAERTRGQLTFDGSSTGMPTYRVDQTGSFNLTVTIPPNSSTGTHTVAANAMSGGKFSEGSPPPSFNFASIAEAAF